jgi:hypothetical protein
VEVNPFTSERLGGGLRSTRYWSTADDQLMVTVRYGWRVDEAGIDLCFYMVWSDPGHMAAYADAVDDFARSLWISDARRKGGNSAGHAPTCQGLQGNSLWRKERSRRYRAHCRAARALRENLP